MPVEIHRRTFLGKTIERIPIKESVYFEKVGEHEYITVLDGKTVVTPTNLRIRSGKRKDSIFQKEEINKTKIKGKRKSWKERRPLYRYVPKLGMENG